MTTLAARYVALPSVMKFAIIALSIVGVYFGLAEPALDRINQLSSRADGKSALLKKHAKGAAALKDAADAVETGIRHFGAVEAPVDSEERPLKFNQAVDKILNQHEVRESTSTSRTAPIGPGPLTSKVAGDYRVDKLMKDIQFIADPASAAAVIADLERLPLVSTISQLQIRQAEGKDKTKIVRVKMVVETWVLARKGKK